MTGRCEARYIEDGWVDMVRCDEMPHGLGDHRARIGDGKFFHWLNEQAIWPKGSEPKVEAPVSEKQVGGDHYKRTAIQPWDIIDDHGLDFYRGNALKYLLRAGKKGDAVQDLRKAIHYIEKCIEREEGK